MGRVFPLCPAAPPQGARGGPTNPLAGSGNRRLFSESAPPTPINISQVVIFIPSAAAGLSFPERISRLKKYNNNNNISFLFSSYTVS